MNQTQHLGIRQPQYVDPADIMEINRGFDTIDQWASGIDKYIVTPPESNKLSILEYLTGTATYEISADGRVTIEGAIGNSDTAYISNNLIIAALPHGFMPQLQVQPPTVYLVSTGNVWLPGTIILYPDGQIRAQFDHTLIANWVYLHFSFRTF